MAILHNMAAVFANTKTHSGPKQIIVYHGHETTQVSNELGNLAACELLKEYSEIWYHMQQGI